MSNLVALGPKPTDSLANLARDLYTQIGQQSDHVHPDQIRDDLEAWQQLRIAAFGVGNRVTAIPGPQAIASLTRYFAQLTHVRTRIPSRSNINFVWYPVAPPAIPSSLSGAAAAATSSPAASTGAARADCTLADERLYTLYTLAYVHAAIGASTRRADETGIRTALAAFQTAAGVLQLVADELDHPSLRLRKDRKAQVHATANEVKTSRVTDLTGEIAHALRILCLAQAQEVAWQKAVMDRLKNGTVAKVAMHAAQLYQQALAQAESVRSGGNVDHFAFADHLSRFLAFKHAHFTAVAHYRRSLDDLGANRYGDELGRLRVCEQVLVDVMTKTGKRGVPEAVVRDLKSLHSMISENLARATKDNDLIYLATPTPAPLLPSIVPFPLAKATVPPELTEPLKHLPAGEEHWWLGAMLPTQVRDALEVWDDRKSTWFAESVQRVARGLDEQATRSLAALNLPAALDSSQQQPVGTPRHLVELSERIRQEGGLAKLETMMKDVRRISSVNRKLVQESRDLLDREAAADTSCRQTYGMSRWTRPASADAASPLLQRVEQFEAVLAAAGQSDELVRAKYGEWESALAVLDRGQTALRNAIPCTAADASPTGSSRSTETRKIARQLRTALETLSLQREERERIVRAAQTRVEQASIRRRLEREWAQQQQQQQQQAGGTDPAAGAGATAGSAQTRVEQILEEELGNLRAPWEQELGTSKARQEDLLDQIARLNGAFSASRDEVGQGGGSAERDEAVRRFETAAAKFDEMQQNLHEGLKFYADLSRLLGELRDAVKEFVTAREADAEERLRQLSAPPSLSEKAEAAEEREDEGEVPAPSRIASKSGRPSTSAHATTGRRQTRAARSAVVVDDGPNAAAPDTPAAISGWDPSQGIRFG
ncbi:hypothetical protein JCM3774_006313 [Rhodotorula dairenensis]